MRGDSDEHLEEVQHGFGKRTSVFQAMFAREMSTLEDSLVPTTSDGVVESSHLELARGSEEAERMIRHLMTQHQAVHPSAWEQVLSMDANSTATDEHTDASTDDELVQKWVMSMAGKMDVDAMLESSMATMLAEATVGGSNSDRLGYFFMVGADVACDMDYAKFTFTNPSFLAMAFLVPILSPSLGGGLTLAFSLGQTSKDNGHHFSLGLSMSCSIGAAVSLDLFKLWNSWAEVAASAIDQMFWEAGLQVCDNYAEGSGYFSLSILPVALLGAPCAPVDAAGGKITSFFGGGARAPWWGFAITAPAVVKALAQIVGMPVDKTPGDFLSIFVGWSDFKDTKDAWFFGLGVNPLPVQPDPTTTDPPGPDSPFVVDLAVGASWTWFLGIPCKWHVPQWSLLATNARSSVRARMEAACTTARVSARGVPASCVGSTGAAALAKCVQESASERLTCGSGAHLEALGHVSASIASRSTPVVDRTLKLKFHGDGAGSLAVRVVAGWVSGLSGLRVVDTDTNSASATSVTGGVRSTMSLASQSDIQLRAVCLQWDATAAKNAFRPITGEGHSTRQRARQMASAMESKLQQDSGSVDSDAHARITSWVKFVKEYDAARSVVADEHEAQRFSAEWASELASDRAEIGTTASQRCFKVRIGGVRAHLDTSVSGSLVETNGAFVGTSADLHSFTLSALSSSLESVAQSPALVQAVAEVLASFDESSAASEVLQSAMRSTIAAQLVAGTQASLERNMCGSLKSVVCPSCEQASVSWGEQCSALVAKQREQ